MPSGAKSRNINKKRPSEKVEQQRGGRTKQDSEKLGWSTGMKKSQGGKKKKSGMR